MVGGGFESRHWQKKKKSLSLLIIYDVMQGWDELFSNSVHPQEVSTISHKHCYSKLQRIIPSQDYTHGPKGIITIT